MEDTKIVSKVLEDIRENITVECFRVNKFLIETDFKPEKLMMYFLNIFYFKMHIVKYKCAQQGRS